MCPVTQLSTQPVLQLEGVADESILMDNGRVAVRRPGIEAAPPVLRPEVRA